MHLCNIGPVMHCLTYLAVKNTNIFESEPTSVLGSDTEILLDFDAIEEDEILSPPLYILT
jgi:hypothetical protein